MIKNTKKLRIPITIFIMVFFITRVSCQNKQASTQVSSKLDYRMIDPSIDDSNKEWCYLAKSNTVIGVPFQHDVTQITYDGALYTGFSELCFFYGKEKKPLLARQKTFLKGWIPVVENSWDDDGIQYNIEMFANKLDGHDASNTLNFVKVTLKNGTSKSRKVQFTASMRGKSSDYRFGPLQSFSPESKYEMTSKAAFRDTTLIYTYPSNANLSAVKGQKYTEPFAGTNYDVKEAANTCIVDFQKNLMPGEEYELIFKMPRIPVSIRDSKFIEEIYAANYDYYRKATIAYWENLLNSEVHFVIPEKRIENAQKASLVHLLLATRNSDSKGKIQTDGIPYPNFFLTSAPQAVLAYLSSGHPDLAKLIVINAISQQEPDGLYFDRALAHGGIIPVAHGHVLYLSTAYYLFTRDKKTGHEIYPSIQKAIAYLKKSMQEDEYGLLPPTYPYDNEMIDGHYTSNNLWALLGLRFAIRMAQDLDETVDVANWKVIEKNYTANILKGLGVSVKEDGYVPPGLYPYLTGKNARRGFEEYQTHSDWENMLLSFPTELLTPHDFRVTGTLNHVRKGYAEGIMTYRHGQHLHQYITANLIEQYMVQGESRQALIDFYHLILHSGSTYEGFENLVSPWTDRQVSEDCPPPHAWASSKIAYLIRNFLIHEFGGEAGILKGKRDLYLFSVVSPEWAKPGEHLAVINAPTEMGKVSAYMNFKENGAELKINTKLHTPPGAIKIRIPYFKELISFETDAKTSSVEDGCISLSTDVSSVTIKWKDVTDIHRGTFEDLLVAYRSSNSFEGVDSKGAAIIAHGKAFLTDNEKQNEIKPLSFEMVKNTFLYEYKRRVNEYLEKGGELEKVVAPILK